MTAGEQPTIQLVAEAAARLQEKGRQKLNAEQRAAVAAVVCGAGRSVPFALFGPPGETLLLYPVLMHSWQVGAVVLAWLSLGT